MADKYHYTEGGLENVWLYGGFEFVDRPTGKQLRIRNIEGLHKVIGEVLVGKKGDLTGKEIRFLRQEMLMTQKLLCRLLGVTEQTIHRWETGKADVPKPAESLIRLVYRSHQGDHGMDVRKALQHLADLEDHIDGMNFTLSNKRGSHWIHQEREAA